MSNFLLRAGVRLDALEPDEVNRLAPEDLTVLRAEYLPRMADEMIDDGVDIQIDGAPAVSCKAALLAWAERMTAKHQSATVVVWRTPLPWVAALAVVRYGEAPVRPEGGEWVRVWPGEWRPVDVARALAWEDGSDVPPAVTGRAIVGASGMSIVRAHLTLTPEG